MTNTQIHRVLACIASGSNITEATRQVGVPMRRFWDRLKQARKASTWIWREYAEVAHQRCELCNRPLLGSTRYISEEIVDEYTMRLVFCSTRCLQAWEENDEFAEVYERGVA